MLNFEGNVSEEHKTNVEYVQNYVNWWNYAGSSNFSWLSFSHLSSQKCENVFVSMSFQGKSLTWKELPEFWKLSAYNWSIFGPRFHPTDFGACCRFTPHLDFEPFGSLRI